MEVRAASNPKDVKQYDTTRLREEFLIDDLFQPEPLAAVGVMPVGRVSTMVTCPAVSILPIFFEVMV